MTFSLALIGCGGVSSMHLEGCARRPERARIVAVCDTDAARVASAQQKYNIAHGFGSLQEMIDSAQWEAAIVCTPTSVRAPIVEALARAGKHIFVEKPMASSLIEGERMVQACEQGGVLLAVDQNFRTHFPFHIAREQIASGALGRVTAIHLQHLCFRQDEGWRTREARHTLEIMGVHWLDGFRWILSSQARTVSAQMRHSNAIQCEGETDLSVQVSFENGAFASYTDSFSSHFNRCEALILGDEGTLRLEYERATLHKRGASEAQIWANPFAGNGKPDSAFEGLDRLLSAMESGSEPDNSGRDNLQTLAMMEAAYQSAQSGATISLQNGML